MTSKEKKTIDKSIARLKKALKARDAANKEYDAAINAVKKAYQDILLNRPVNFN